MLAHVSDTAPDADTLHVLAEPGLTGIPGLSEALISKLIAEVAPEGMLAA